MHRFTTEVIAGQEISFSPLTIPPVAYNSPEAELGREHRKRSPKEEPKGRNIRYKKGNFLWKASKARALTAGAGLGADKPLFEWHL